MPVDGLPPAVETVLVQMLEQNILSSWRITGGDKYATVSLHFRVSMADQPGGMSHMENKQYRSKPPSAITRDRKRFNTWKFKQDEQKCDNLESVDFTNMNSVNVEGSKGNGVAVAHISVQTDGRTLAPGAHLDGQSINSSGLDSGDLISGHDITGPSKQQDVNITSSDTHSLDCHDDSSITETPNASTDEVLLDVPLCDCCQNEVKSDSWWKCTKCICDICVDCVRNGGHSSHSDQLHKFTMPANSDSYCDSCGFEFKTRQAQYYMCISCENYALCQICNKDNMHQHHLMTMRCRGQVT